MWPFAFYISDFIGKEKKDNFQNLEGEIEHFIPYI